MEAESLPDILHLHGCEGAFYMADLWWQGRVAVAYNADDVETEMLHDVPLLYVG